MGLVADIIKTRRNRGSLNFLTVGNILPRWVSVVGPNSIQTILDFADIKLGDRTLYLDPLPEFREEAASEARQAEQELRRNRWVGENYIEIDRAMEVESEPGQWLIGTFLTERSEAMLAAFNEGLAWDTYAGCPDPDESDRYWRAYLLQGSVSEAVFNQVRNLKHPILMPVVRDFVAFKLAAETDGFGNWQMARAQAKELFFRNK